MELELRQRALEILCLKEPAQKLAAMAEFDLKKHLSIDTDLVLSEQDGRVPGRPDKPELVPPLEVRRRAMNTIEGRAVLIHALAHIEFNAINLALDAVWRFSGMPREYYLDWLKVAKEEAYHFDLLQLHLNTLGYTYGDFPSHNSLWEMVEKTKDSILARMALVPRTMEARGLDALPPILDRLKQVKDTEAVRLLEIIYRDEIGHVQIGNRWYHHICEQEGIDPVSTYMELAKRYNAPKLKGPINRQARLAAGFTDFELDAFLEPDGP